MNQLKNCPTCQNPTSSAAQACPKCGEPFSAAWAIPVIPPNSLTSESKPRVLLLEDDPDIQELLVTCLENLGGFEVMALVNGEEIVEKALAFLPDIISLDIMMPVVGGLQALEAIKSSEELKDIPTVIITAKAMKKDLVVFHDFADIDIISKPFDPLDLANQFKRILEGQDSQCMLKAKSRVSPM